MKHIVIGTAGHIDHGKSTLIKTLTGIDPDRLEEEKRRGMTLDLGYAHMQLESGAAAGFVDVPGHPKYVRNMLAGVGGTHAVLLVVAADDGVMPQTREHVEILSLLGAKRGLVALTKIDMVDSGLAELAQAELRDFLQGTFLRNAPIFPVSAITGQGLPELRKEIARICEESVAADADDALRIFADRCFTMRGFGTVLAGTVLAGRVEKGHEVELYPTGQTARVRGVQVYGEPVDAAWPGQRAALNLIGVEADCVDRGIQISEPGRFFPCSEFEASIEVLESSPHQLKSKGRYLIYHGSAEYEAGVSVLGGRGIAPGEKGLVRVRLASPALLLPRDRYILRSPIPGFTLGGGAIRNLQPSKRRTRPFRSTRWPGDDCPLSEYVLYLTCEKGACGLTEAALLSYLPESQRKIRDAVDDLCNRGLLRKMPNDKTVIITPQDLEKSCVAALHAIDTFHRADPLAPGMDKEHLRSLIFPQAERSFYEAVLSELEQSRRIVTDAHRVKRPDWTVTLTPQQSAAKRYFDEEAERAGWALVRREHLLERAGIPRESASQLLAMLVEEGRLVVISHDTLCHHSVLEQLKQLLVELGGASARLDLQKFKEATGTSRSQAIPLLEYADKLGLTRREGADRWIR